MPKETCEVHTEAQSSLPDCCVPLADLRCPWSSVLCCAVDVLPAPDALLNCVDGCCIAPVW